MSDNHYEVIHANAIKSKDIYYSVGYKMFSEKMEFKNKDKLLGEQEVEDQHSAYFMVKKKPTAQLSGAMSLIFQNGQSRPIVRYFSLNKKVSQDDIKSAIDVSYKVEEESEAIQETCKDAILHDQKINRSLIWGGFSVSFEGYLMQ